MQTLISLGFLFILILHAGAFGVQSAWGNDLNITLENEVAGITPDMEFLAPEKGTLLGNGNPGMMVTSGTYSYLKKDPKVESAYFSPKTKSFPKIEIDGSQRILGVVSSYFETNSV